MKARYIRKMVAALGQCSRHSFQINCRIMADLPSAGDVGFEDFVEIEFDFAENGSAEDGSGFGDVGDDDGDAVAVAADVEDARHARGDGIPGADGEGDLADLGAEV